MSRVSEQTISRVEKLLKEWPADKPLPCFADIAFDLGMTEHSASRAIKHLHANRLVHLKWRYPERGVASKAAQVWVHGPGVDEVKRARLTRKRQKENNKEAKQRERQWLEENRRPVKPFRHWQDQALFGPA